MNPARRILGSGCSGDWLTFVRWLFFVILFSGITTEFLFASTKKGDTKKTAAGDTIYIRSGNYYFSRNLVVHIPNDTFYIVSKQRRSSRDTAYFMNSRAFYDSVYHKFSRNRITRFLYPLAFVQPVSTSLLPKTQVEKTETPFIQYHGKIIGDIRIMTMDPFGTSVYDTTANATTGAGKTLNGVHMKTRNYIIRRNLLFKKGDSFDAALVGDNERLLRDLDFIDNARILVTETGENCDSVNILVVAKDVFSIAFDVPLITPSRVGFRLYDGNFLGLGDRFTIKMSTELFRAPFFRFDGVTYTTTNILGSFIDGTIDYYTDNSGDEGITLSFVRPFISNQLSWAGGITVDWWKDLSLSPDAEPVESYFHDENIWLGNAIQVVSGNEPVRAILSGAFYHRQFIARPPVSIDTNRGYYNRTLLLGSFAVSKNGYYVTDYLLDFGKPENLAYGYLVQVNYGPEYTDFYRRLYGGIQLAGGAFFDHFGYIQGSIKAGGFLFGDIFEDGVIKFNCQYFTPLYMINAGRFKLRNFVSVNYRYGFNFRTNNAELYDANLIFRIDRVFKPSDFAGRHILSGSFGSVLFTPLYFYGFRFALKGQIELGLVQQPEEPLWRAPLYYGFGASLMIKNDNLIFPTILISGFIYPVNSYDVPLFQGTISSGLHYERYDFNATAPKVETIGN
jgi:hypothetical protein